MRIFNLFHSQYESGNEEELLDTIFDSSRKKAVGILNEDLLLTLRDKEEVRKRIESIDYWGIDGNLLSFGIWKLAKTSLITKIYINWVIKLHKYIRIPLFFLFFGIQYVSNYIHSTLTLAINYPYIRRTGIKSVNYNLFGIDIIKRSAKEDLKVAIINQDKEGDKVVTRFIQKAYPDLRYAVWDRDVKLLIRVNEEEKELNIDNLYINNPDLWEIRNFLFTEEADIVMISLGDKLIETEMFIKKLKEDTDIKARAITALKITKSKKLKPFEAFIQKLKILSIITLESFVFPLSKKDLSLDRFRVEVMYEEDSEIVSLEQKPIEIKLKPKDTIAEASAKALSSISDDIGKFAHTQEPRLIEASKISTTFKEFLEGECKYVYRRTFKAYYNYTGSVLSLRKNVTLKFK